MTHHTNNDNCVIGLFRDAQSAGDCISQLKRSDIAAENIMIAQKGRERAVGQSGVSRIDSQGGLEGILDLFGLGTGLPEKLHDFGFPYHDALLYADRVDSGDILLATRCSGECKEVEQVFNRCGALEVDSTFRYGSGYIETGYDAGYQVGEEREVGGQVRKEVPRIEKKADVRDQDLRDRDVRDEDARDDIGGREL